MQAIFRHSRTRQTQRPEAGFTAVELLVTLFVGVGFLVLGHQLFAVVTESAHFQQQRSAALSTAREYMNKYAATVPQLCDGQGKVYEDLPTVEGIGKVRVVSIVRCANPALTTLSSISVTATYGDENLVVKAATYASRK